MADENGKDLTDEAAESTGGAAENLVEEGKELAGDAGELVGDVAGSAGDKASDAAEAVGDAAGAATDKVGDSPGGVTDAFDGDGDSSSVLQWLLPLLLLGLLLVLFFMFCTKNPANAPAANTNETSKVATESAGNLIAKEGKYTIPVS